jgi:hypothetical protein
MEFEGDRYIKSSFNSLRFSATNGSEANISTDV